MDGCKAKSLTPKQALFVKEYIIDMNAYRAALRAGYKNGEIGRQLITKTNVSKALKLATDKIATKLQLTAESVLKDIKDIGDKALEAKKYGDALKSRELLGKHLKLFTDKVELGFDDSAFKAILAILPPEYAEEVKKALSMHKS